MDILSQVLAVITGCHCYARDHSGLAGYAVIAMHALLSLGNKLTLGKQMKCYDR